MKTHWLIMLLLIVSKKSDWRRRGGGSDIEIYKHPGQVSRRMRVLASMDVDLISYFDKINEIEVNGTAIKQTLNNNHTVVANKGKISGQLKPLFGFFKIFGKVTTQIGSYRTVKMADS